MQSLDDFIEIFEERLAIKDLRGIARRSQQIVCNGIKRWFVKGIESDYGFHFLIMHIFLKILLCFLWYVRISFDVQLLNLFHKQLSAWVLVNIHRENCSQKDIALPALIAHRDHIWKGFLNGFQVFCFLINDFCHFFPPLQPIDTFFCSFHFTYLWRFLWSSLNNCSSPISC